MTNKNWKSLHDKRENFSFKEVHEKKETELIRPQNYIAVFINLWPRGKGGNFRIFPLLYKSCNYV